ncbi:MAG: hypothetical protein L0H31_13885 [Nocardioidaceae bacterium]|nr:hypothetical protein [Nocardioidaceae bacterium]
MRSPARVLTVVRARVAAVRGTRVVAVDDEAIELVAAGEDRVIDVDFDGRRIWSFWLVRDTVRLTNGNRRAEWPDRMRRFLNGETRLTVREHVGEESYFDAERHFGNSHDRIAFVNKRGLEISLDKSNRFSPTFAVRSPQQLVPLLDAMDVVTAMLRDLGIEAFPAYGTLLGAVREGTFLGHDSDADLGYVSACSTPTEMIRESFELQRKIVARGYATHRYSGGAFRIDVTEADGSARGLDLFGGFFDEGRLFLLGEVGVRFERSWIYPLGTCSLMDREFPAPARPDLLLEAMYGPQWKVPDPAYKFETPQPVIDRFNAWFRGTTVWRRDWEREFALTGGRRPSAGASGLARRLAAETRAGTHVLDVGAGRTRDALWLARQGFTTTAYDYAPRGARGAVKTATDDGLPLETRTLNLTEWRSMLAETARLTRTAGPRVMLARHLVDATNQVGRDALLRFARTALRGGGRFYADVWTGEGEPGFGLRPFDPDRLAALVESHGGTVLSLERLAPSDKRSRGLGRVVASWS